MEKAQRKPDRRIAKSKKAIRNAFMVLLAKEDINDITIKDIADLADVDRKTVYNYYNGTYEILSEIENDLVKSINDAVIELNFKSNIEHPLVMFETISNAINSNFDLYSHLMKMNSESQLIKKLISLFKSYVEKALQQIELPEGTDIDVAATFITAGTLNAYYVWFNSDRKTSLQDLSKQIGLLILYGIEKK